MAGDIAKKQAAQARCLAARRKWLAQMVRKNAIKPDGSGIDYAARLNELAQVPNSPRGE